MKVQWNIYISAAIAFLYLTGFIIAGRSGYRQRRSIRGGAKTISTSCHCGNEFFILFQVYGTAAITVFDYFTDVYWMITWLASSITRRLGCVSLAILLVQRIISALIFAQEDGYLIGICQFFDIEVFRLITVSVKYKRPVYGLKKYKIIQGLCESFPQLLVWIWYVRKFTSEIKSQWQFHLSVTASLISLVMCYLINDVVGRKQAGTKNRSEPVFLEKLIWNAFCFASLGLWRVGELATKFTGSMAFATAVKWRHSSILGFVGMIANFILVSIYDEPKKATIFYRNTYYDNEQVLIVKEPADSNQEIRIIEVASSQELCGVKAKQTELELQEIEAEESELQEVTRQIFLSVMSSGTRCKSNLFTRIVNILFTVTNCVGACVFYYLALPSLCPSSYVIRYYIFKIMIECIQMGFWINFQRTRGDLFHSQPNELPFLRYWLIGTICFMVGGLVSWVFVIDAAEWKKSLEPNDKTLLKMTERGQYVYLDRVFGNRICTLKDIIERTTLQRGDFLEESKFSYLLCELLKHGVIKLGPTYGVLKNGTAKSSKYENYVASALLSNYDGSPSESRVSELAKRVLSDLLNDNSGIRFSLEDLRNAGASLTFLRFQMEVPIEYFFKGGVFKCTAEELYQEKFDLLFCLKCRFTEAELIASGFKEEHVTHQIFTDLNNCKLKDLKFFGPMLLEMHFYVKQLKDSKAFSNGEILDWIKIYKSELLNRESNVRFNPAGRKNSEFLKGRKSRGARLRGFTNAVELSKRREPKLDADFSKMLKVKYDEQISIVATVPSEKKDNRLEPIFVD